MTFKVKFSERARREFESKSGYLWLCGKWVGEDEILTVYGSQEIDTGGSTLTMFLFYINDEWDWIYCENFAPYEGEDR